MDKSAIALISALSLSPTQQAVVEGICAEFAALPQVLAIALAGSQTTTQSDFRSDLDIYIYQTAEIPVEVRSVLATRFAQHCEINNQFWETGDEWLALEANCGVDLMYRRPEWIEAQLERVLVHHQASVGYSTCFWANVLNSQVLYDRTGWFEQLQQKARQPYPAALQRAIIALNYPILRQTISSYRHQLELAIARQDWVSVNHRVAAFLASYFDILFAANGVPHPGEKRLVAWIEQSCDRYPENLGDRVRAVLEAISPSATGSLLTAMDTLADGLDCVLQDTEFAVNADIGILFDY
ncbi:DUF4037 domain-containing protein [Desertifilum sp. FACHB-1129]|nr:DUF4037 domain-containing protein [Desertifilum sp. FACHB-1129]MBD2324479.1 DUF4037 domain-containing protein [Desertifilum sp. FACHB-866]MBD2334493.1 DUF4037 domain-containing protein [Desertifilum sp. FACHB-868]